MQLLWYRQKLHLLPSSPPTLLTSQLLSPLEKWRLLQELSVLPLTAEQDESVFSFAERRFGLRVAEVFTQAGISGITAGDAKQLSIGALFPRVRQLETTHGSLIKALLKAPKPSRPTRLLSFSGGLQTLIDALTKQLGNQLRLDCPVEGIQTIEGGYRVFSSGKVFEAKQLVLSTPAQVSAALLQSLAPSAARQLEQLEYAPAWVFGLAFKKSDLQKIPSGFGFLRSSHDLRSLGVLYTSSVFPAHAPQDLVYLRVIAGGSLDPLFMQLTRDQAIATICADLQRSLGIEAAPVAVQDKRWESAIPQYKLGHPTTLALPNGLHLLCNAFGGVGVNDCIRNAFALAKQL